jgi:hypothetical protein
VSKQYKNKGHLSFIHGFKCCLGYSGACFGEVQAHHLLKPWEGYRGMGMKASDRNVIPLCLGHHQALHSAGNEFKYFESVSGREDYGKNVAEILWNLSPYFEKV